MKSCITPLQHPHPLSPPPAPQVDRCDFGAAVLRAVAGVEKKLLNPSTRPPPPFTSLSLPLLFPAPQINRCDYDSVVLRTVAFLDNPSTRPHLHPPLLSLPLLFPAPQVNRCDFDAAVLRAVAGVEKKRSILQGVEKDSVAKHEVRAHVYIHTYLP
jgi:hypothetical protein